jgi:hypothetical protein
MSEVGEGAQIEERKIARSVDELPELKEGYARLVHFTHESVTDVILESGLDYKRHGMVMSTASPYADEKDVEYSTDDPRFSGKGTKAVILDVPFAEYRLHNDVTKAPGLVPAEYVVGVVDPTKNHGR